MTKHDATIAIINLKLTYHTVWRDLFNTIGYEHWPSENAMKVAAYRAGYRNPVEKRGKESNGPVKSPVPAVSDACLLEFAKEEYDRRKPHAIDKATWIRRFAEGDIL